MFYDFIIVNKLIYNNRGIVRYMHVWICGCMTLWNNSRFTGRPQCRDSNGCLYNPGMSYVNAACTGRCTCLPNGKFGCVSLCPPRAIECPPGDKLEDYYEPVKGTYCQCRRKRCVPGKCWWNIQNLIRYSQEPRKKM